MNEVRWWSAASRGRSAPTVCGQYLLRSGSHALHCACGLFRALEPPGVCSGQARPVTRKPAAPFPSSYVNRCAPC